MRRLVATLAALVMLAAASEAAAGATTRLTIKVWPEGKGSGAPRVWSLRCEPAGGSLPRADRACRALFAHPGALRRPGPKAVCTEQWGGPQVASLRGLVRGRRVVTTITRANGCEISRWNRLRPLLPLRK